MIGGVWKDGTEILRHNDITYTHVNGYSYGLPFVIEIGAMEHLIDADKLIIGELYSITTKYNKMVELVLSEVNPHQNTVENQASTAFIFMHLESHFLNHNLYAPSESVWGLSLKKYIIGGKNQLQIAVFELRKMGLMFAVDQDFNVLQRHSTEFLNDEDKFLSNPTSEKNIKRIPARKNYASIELITKKGGDRPNYIPLLTESEIEGLDMFIEPQIILQSDDENPNVTMGYGVIYKESKYCVMEKNAVYIREKLRTIFTLGVIPE